MPLIDTLLDPHGWLMAGRLITAPRVEPGALRFTEGRLRSANGDHVMLRGVSLFWSQWAPAFYNARIVQWLAADWRINVLRVPIAAAAPGYLSDPGAEFEKAATVVDAALRCGLYVIVDWHGHEPHTEQAINLFEQFTRRYLDCPNILYESWNEPGREYAWPTIREHHEAVVDRVRQFAPSAIVLCGVPDFCTCLEVVARDPVRADNIGYTFHFYAASHRQGLRRRLERALDAELPIFVSEWGASEANGDGILDFEEADRWLRLLTARSVPHVAWSVHDKAEASALLKPGASPEGGWRSRDVSESGNFVRKRLRQPV
ncbi:MAG: glycoside hydrolase family 5 protein [Sphingomonas bacterium]